VARGKGDDIVDEDAVMQRLRFATAKGPADRRGRSARVAPRRARHRGDLLDVEELPAETVDGAAQGARSSRLRVGRVDGAVSA
jgi:hypothetical protein